MTEPAPSSTDAPPPAAAGAAEAASRSAPDRRGLSPFLRVVASFLAVLAGYTTYALAVVPWLEPPLQARPTVDIAPEAIELARTAVERQRAQLRTWFRDGDWELDSPKVLETPQGIVLVKDYRHLAAGRIEIRPCTIIFLPPADKPTENEETRRRRAVVLRAPEGALLEFDKAVDLKQARIGRLTGGRLMGQVTIASGQQLPGPEDDLLIVTRDLELVGHEITTPHAIEFRLGPNEGHGQGLTITLGEPGQPAPLATGGFPGVRAFELARDIEIRLEPGEGDFFPGSTQPKSTPVAATSTPATAGNAAAAPAPAGPRVAPPAALAAAEGPALLGPAPPGADRVATGREGAPPNPATAASPAARQPVDIRCRGPFRFDLVAYRATFEKQVDVVRQARQGPADQLNCEYLSIFFLPAVPPQGAAPANEPDRAVPRMPKLTPYRIEALGNPVVIRAPGSGVQARCQQVEYDLRERRGSFRDEAEVILRQGEREIHARQIEFAPDASGRYGEFLCLGAGWFQGATPDDAAQTIRAEWREQLHFRRHVEEHVLSLHGEARVTLPGRGQIETGELHVWFDERETPGPTAADKPRHDLVPDRLLARGRVTASSPQLQAVTEQLEAWFEGAPVGVGQARRAVDAAGTVRRVAQAGERVLLWTAWFEPPGGALRFPDALPAAGAAPPGHATGGPGPLGPNGPTTGTPWSGLPGMTGPPPLVAPAGSPTPPGPLAPVGPALAGPGPEPAIVARYRLEGSLIRLQLLLSESEPQLTEALVEQRVRLVEAPLDGAPSTPLVLEGDRLHLVQPAPGRANANLVGRPAVALARGMTMKGASLRMDQGQNLLTVDGEGLMTLPVNRDLEGRPTAEVRPLEITWRERMTFDGLRAVFDRAVVARLDEQRLRAEQLEVILDRQVRFDREQAGPEPGVFRVNARRNVELDSRTLEGTALVSIDTMRVAELSVEPPTGNVYAAGPGSLRTVRRGGAEFAPGAGGPGTPPPGAGATLPGGAQVTPAAFAPAGPSAPAADDGLTFLHVDFRRQLTGNFQRREVTFDGQVQALYGPVITWESVLDASRPETWGPRGGLLNADQLTVAEVRVPGQTQGAVEMLATGAVYLEGSGFSARARRLSYARQKDLLVLEGDGRAAATLFRQAVPGEAESKLSARKIMYWPGTNRAQVEGAEQLDLTTLPRGPAAPEGR